MADGFRAWSISETTEVREVSGVANDDWVTRYRRATRWVSGEDRIDVQASRRCRGRVGVGLFVVFHGFVFVIAIYGFFNSFCCFIDYVGRPFDDIFGATASGGHQCERKERSKQFREFHFSLPGIRPEGRVLRRRDGRHQHAIRYGSVLDGASQAPP